MSRDYAAARREVLDRIAAAAERAGRVPDEITLVAVAKTFPADVVLRAIEAGCTDIGENRAQELKDKMMVIGDRARWHFVGHLQSNKVRVVAGRTHLIHSIDRLALADAVARRARSLGVVQDALIEVNLAGEETKHGVEPPRALQLADEADALDGIRIRGVMAIPPAVARLDDARAYFRELRALRDRLVVAHPDASELSMGMSRDFEVAIEEGATLVRVGEAIFGRRGTP